MTRIAKVMVATLALAACGPLAQETRSEKLTTRVVGMLRGVTGNAAPAAPTGHALTRAEIDASPVPQMLMAIPARNGNALMQKVGENGSRVTWLSPDGISVTTEGGIVVASRGLGDDLYAADVHEIRANMRDGGTGARVHEYLSGTDRIARPTMNCVIRETKKETITIVEKSYDTTVYEERCQNAQFDFTNRYWQDETGNLVQSQQWIAFGVGYLVTQLL